MGGTFAFSTAPVPCAAAARAPGFLVHSLELPRVLRRGGCGGGAAVAPHRQRRRQEGTGGARSRRLAPPLAKKPREGAWMDDEEEQLGAAFRVTLSMLDWERLCGQVGGAGTGTGTGRAGLLCWRHRVPFISTVQAAPPAAHNSA